MQPETSLLTVGLAAAFLSTTAFANSADVISCEVTDEEFTRIIGLSLQDFDQNSGDGWRPFYESGCYELAAQLLTAYMAGYPDRVGHYMLPFHAGQMYAINNEYEKAERLMRQAYSPRDSAKIDWNAFVDANIAFLRKDRAMLLRMRQRIAKQPEMTEAMGAPEWAVGKKMNLDVVDGFIACFDEPYSVAYDDECRAIPIR
jgi:hypothetical protein